MEIPTPELLLSPREESEYRKLALDEAFTRLYPWILEAARKAIRGRDRASRDADVAAADVVGDIYCDWEKILAAYTPGGNAEAYLRRVIQNRLTDRWRRRKVRDPFGTPSDTGVEIADRAEEVTPAEVEELRAILATLSDDDRNRLELRYREDLTFKEAAERCGETLSMFYRALNEVIDKLKDRYNK